MKVNIFFRKFFLFIFVLIFSTSLFSATIRLENIKLLSLYDKIYEKQAQAELSEDQIKKSINSYEFENLQIKKYITNNIDLVSNLIYRIHFIEKNTDYYFKYVIASGGEKIIFEVINKDDDLFALALFFNKASRQNNFSNEVLCLKKLDNENIIKIIENDSKLFYYVQSLADIDLLDFTNNSELNIVESLKIILGIAKGLLYLNKNNIIHRDLKLENILLYEEKKGNFIPKIIDFSFALHLSEGEDFILAKCLQGTLRYISPRVLKGHVEGSSEANICRITDDIYSFGVIIYELFYRNSFNGFFQKKYKQLDEKINYLLFVSKLLNSGQRPKLSEEQDFNDPVSKNGHSINSLIKGCWTTLDKDRLSIEEIVKILDALVVKFDEHCPNIND